MDSCRQTANSELQSLLERVEKEKGTDREIDADLDVALRGGEIQWRQANYTMDMHPVARRPSGNHLGGYEHEHVPLYTASIDAALALAERVLPGWDYEITGIRAHGAVAILWKEGWRDDWERATRSESATPPLAILAALLKALIAQKQGTTYTVGDLEGREGEE